MKKNMVQLVELWQLHMYQIKQLHKLYNYQNTYIHHKIAVVVIVWHVTIKKMKNVVTRLNRNLTHTHNRIQNPTLTMRIVMKKKELKYQNWLEHLQNWIVNLRKKLFIKIEEIEEIGEREGEMVKMVKRKKKINLIYIHLKSIVFESWQNYVIVSLKKIFNIHIVVKIWQKQYYFFGC